MALPNSPPTPTITSAGLCGLPTELLGAITSDLPNKDLKSLRLVCTHLGEQVLLRIHRVFLSANPLNIKVCKAIADHETYRQGVVELVWDDARIERPPDIMKGQHSGGNHCKNCAYLNRLNFRMWFQDACGSNLRDVENVMRQHENYPGQKVRAQWIAAQPSFDERERHYSDLLNQQCEVVKTSEDAYTIPLALKRFPSLRRITLTPAAHGAYFTPLYETPMIRALPYGFNWPTPRGWPTGEWGGKRGSVVPVTGWTDSEQDNPHKSQWRGFQIITRMLANNQHNVAEFIVDSSLLNTGVNGHIFDEPCQEYNDFVMLLSSPGLRRIDLSLAVGGQREAGWPMFRNKHLRDALSKGLDLEHISIRLSAHSELIQLDGRGDKNFIPLLTTFPVDKWPKLKHIGLPGFIVRNLDVISFLSALLMTVKSIDLSFPLVQKHHGTLRELVIAMRDELNWRQRAVSNRPRVIMGRFYDHGTSPCPGQAVWVDDEVNEFIYGMGEDPFQDGRSLSNVLRVGVGTMRNVFDPTNQKLVPLEDSMRCKYAT